MHALLGRGGRVLILLQTRGQHASRGDGGMASELGGSSRGRRNSATPSGTEGRCVSSEDGGAARPPCERRDGTRLLSTEGRAPLQDGRTLCLLRMERWHVSLERGGTNPEGRVSWGRRDGAPGRDGTLFAEGGKADDTPA